MWNENDINLSAARGDRMPGSLTPPEQCCFLSLRNLYSLYNKKMISREQAVKEKNEIFQQYRIWSNAYTQHWNDCVELQARNHISQEWVAKLHKGLKENEPDRKLMAMACYCLGIILQDRPLADIASDILAMEE